MNIDDTELISILKDADGGSPPPESSFT